MAKDLILTKPPTDEMCPPGRHVVQGHERTCQSGTQTWVDAHTRKNRGKIPKILLIENILYLYRHSKHRYPRTGKIFGYPENGALDPVIQFWSDYWKRGGLKFPGGLDSLMIKTIIAIESTFDPSVKTKVKGGSATGLMQITGSARDTLSGRKDKHGYRDTPSPWRRFIKNPRRIAELLTFLAVLTVSSSVHAINGKIPLDNTELELPDGRKLETVRCGTHCHCLGVTRDKRKLRKQCYQEEFDRLWDYAFFIPVKPGKYVADIDGDGNPEIAVATWDGGNNITNRYGLAFSLKGNKLVYFGRKKFNLEYGEFLYDESEKGK